MGKRTGWTFRLLAIVFMLACIIAAYWILVPLVAGLIGVEPPHG